MLWKEVFVGVLKFCFGGRFGTGGNSGGFVWPLHCGNSGSILSRKNRVFRNFF